MEYNCAKCGKAVLVVDGKINRDCDCKEAVIANVRAALAGAGGVK